MSKKITLFLLILTLAMCFVMLGNTAHSANAESSMYESELQDNEILYEDALSADSYNCYSFALGDYENWLSVGALSGEILDIESATIEQIANAVVADLETIGCTGIIVSDTRPTSVAQNQHLICVRKGRWDAPSQTADYHFMKYYDGNWYHKSGDSASIFKYKYQPSVDRDWIIFKSLYNVIYTGKIYYIKYYPSTYNSNNGCCEVNNYEQLKQIRHNCASNFKTKIMSNIYINQNSEFELDDIIWKRVRYFYGELDGLNHTINGLDFYYDYTAAPDGYTSEYHYYLGFIQHNYGVIKNVAFCNIEDNMCMGSYPQEVGRSKVGIIASENYGTIQNCFVGTTIIDGEIHLTAKTLSSIGAVSGVNYGTIKNCLIDYCHIKSFGRLGGVAGENRGTIENCSVSNSELISYYGAVGGVAGINYLSVSGCTVSDTFIGCYYEYPDAQYFNEWEVDKYGKAGGIAGWNDGGVINPCSVVGNTVKYCGASINAANGGRSFAPEIGLICGVSKPLTGTFINNDSVVDKGNLHVETWKGGFLNLVTYTWNQAQYCGGNVGHTL